MQNKGFWHSRYQALLDMSYIFREELRQVVKDEGVLIFFILVPLAYPLLYSWLYNNEVVEDVPAVVVDDSHSFLSRDFIRRCDATAGIRVASYATDMEAAKRLLEQQKCRGIIHIPSDFSLRLNRGEQAHVSLYADMSSILYYKALLASITDVQLEMGRDIQVKKLDNYTERDDDVGTRPLDYEAVPMFNPAGGYGSFLLPAVLILIIQQTLLLGIGLSAGTARENNRFQDLVPMKRHYNGMYRIVFGKGMCYFLVYAVMTAYLTLIVPKLFHFIQAGRPTDLLAVLIPYVLACIFFGMTLSCMVRYRENVILLIVFTSVPLLFLSGISWPGSAIHGSWRAISYLFPSTFGVNAYVKINSMGADLSDVLFEYHALWLQVAFYFLTACLVYRNQITISRKHVLERLEMMKKRKTIVSDTK